jgi:hypothetical protein
MSQSLLSVVSIGVGTLNALLEDELLRRTTKRLLERSREMRLTQPNMSGKLGERNPSFKPYVN